MRSEAGVNGLAARQEAVGAFQPRSTIRVRLQAAKIAPLAHRSSVRGIRFRRSSKTTSKRTAQAIERAWRAELETSVLWTPPSPSTG
jgi:hypothetical protein